MSLTDVCCLFAGVHVVVVCFVYRGSWCPFCSIELASHNARVSDYAALNTELFAVTPTLQSGNAATVKSFGLNYRVLSDVNNEVAKEYGTLNQLNEDLAKVHEKLGTYTKEGANTAGDHH